MGLLQLFVKNGAADIAGKAGHDKARTAHWQAIKKGIAEAESAHKRKFTLRGNGPVDPVLLTMRHGAAGLSGSYTSRLLKENLIAIYGSAKEYAAIHEFGGMAGRGRKTRIPMRPGVKMTEEYIAPKLEEGLAIELSKVGL
ncbi:MAG TPA: phage virion morphogenesis protein [Candidatus Krumholzibacteria bacterium]|nr:phage virion morphogenesis protein [Candidatus Krumholzibacteria bacterium]HPD73517.1 phage virion morphogenesis protein [Candidatus Krumholzibacteria bacterium]HRY42239.1 phage virion morphogenesis protein [Candidatus Krumholzibacteria bacterium]